MNKFHRALRVVICGLILLCSFGANAYPAGLDDDSTQELPCVTEVLHTETPAYAMPKDLKFSLTFKKGEDLGIPREFLTEESTLKEVYKYTLDPDKLKGSHTFQKELVVQAKNGQKYQGLKGKPFLLDSPTANYVAMIPAGTKLIKKGDAAAEKYELANDLTVDIVSPENILILLKLVAQTIVERIPDYETSSMGSTLTVEPKKAPPGGYIRLTVKKREFDFGKARFSVCLRLHGNKKQFFASDDVELQKALTGEAVLRARIPEKIDGLGGVHFAKRVDLLVVASIPGEVEGKTVEPQRAEVMTQEFSVSSRRLAGICWILAFVIPWFIAALVAVQTGGTPANQKARWQAWKAQLNPIWIVSGKTGGASLSLAQILLWTILVFSASFYVLVVSGKLLDLTNDVLVLLGIAGGASVIAKITASVKEEKGQTLAGAAAKEPKWLDLIQTEGRPDLYKFQMALFTVLAVFFVAGKIYGTLEFPELPAGLLTLIGISNGVYLAAKATSKTGFEKLADKDEELKKAKEEAEKRKAESDEKENLRQKAEEGKKRAEAERDDTQNKLTSATTDQERDNLTKLLAQQKAAAEDAAKRLKEAEEKKKEANDAKAAADNRVTGLQTEVENLKRDIKQEEASKQG